MKLIIPKVIIACRIAQKEVRRWYKNGSQMLSIQVEKNRLLFSSVEVYGSQMLLIQEKSFTIVTELPNMLIQDKKNL